MHSIKGPIIALLLTAATLAGCGGETLHFDLAALNFWQVPRFLAAASWWNDIAHQSIIDDSSPFNGRVEFSSDIDSLFTYARYRYESGTHVIYFADDPQFWVMDQDCFELVTKHELGHALGLHHSDDPNSIMYPLLNCPRCDTWTC